MKKISLILLSLFLSGVLILSIPILNYFMEGGLKSDKKKEATPVSIVRDIKQLKTATPKRKPKTPERQKPTRTQMKGGPRFAMNLDVAGMGGVGVSMDMTKKGTGGRRVNTDGDVDDIPSIQGSISLRSPPPEIKKREIDAIVRLSFCVNPAGRAYDIKVVEESPPGLGMAEAGKQALQAAIFVPAVKDGNSVAFCGMEQELGVRFDD